MNQEVAVSIPLNRTRRNPKIDPRKGRKKASFETLVRSVREQGVIQPIVVRPVNDDPN